MPTELLASPAEKVRGRALEVLAAFVVITTAVVSSQAAVFCGGQRASGSIRPRLVHQVCGSSIVVTPWSTLKDASQNPHLYGE